MATEKVYEVHAEIIIRLTQQDIDDIMASALDDGIYYWCDRVVVDGEYLGEYASDQISRGGTLQLYVIDPLTMNGVVDFKLDLEKFVQGFRLWVENGGDEYGAVSTDGVDCGMIDSVCADEIIQYALFNEVIFD